jgi:hypothetical protein
VWEDSKGIVAFDECVAINFPKIVECFVDFILEERV